MPSHKMSSRSATPITRNCSTTAGARPNPVGRLVLHLFGRTEAIHLEQSDCICSALQLINFWQDVAVDWEKERIYLPQTDLPRFKISEADISNSRWSANWAALMDFEIDRARD
jgi:phytoene/squalene synthetase